MAFGSGAGCATVFDSGAEGWLDDAAYFAVNSLVKPTSVIVSHAEQPVTTNGQMNSNTRTAVFTSLVDDVPVYLPLSGVTMEFNGTGRCQSACQRR